MIISGHSLVKNNKIQIDTGLKFVSEPKFDRDYILMANPSENIQNTPILIYNPGNIVKILMRKLLQNVFRHTFPEHTGTTAVTETLHMTKMPQDILQ